MQYIASTTAGLEEIVWLDIINQLKVKQLFVGHREIHFEYSGHPKQLLGLRSPDDIFVYTATIRHIDHTRASLENIRTQIAKINFDETLEIIQRVRNLAKSLIVHITTSYLGKRNYSRYDIRDAVQAGIQQNYQWSFTDRTDQADIDIRILVIGTKASVGIRLSPFPLHRRLYKICNLPGSLKPSVAYCLCLLALIKSNDIVIDPMCGVGTIALEVAHIIDKGLILSSDIHEETIRCALRNCTQSRTILSPKLYVNNVSRLSIPDNIASKVISNLPWGRQIKVKDKLEELYLLALKEIHRVLFSGGRAVLLTDQPELLARARLNVPNMHVVFTKQISLYGSHPTIHVLSKGPIRGERFSTTSRFGRELNKLVERNGIQQIYRIR